MYEKETIETTEFGTFKTTITYKDWGDEFRDLCGFFLLGMSCLTICAVGPFLIVGRRLLGYPDESCGSSSVKIAECDGSPPRKLPPWRPPDDWPKSSTPT